MAAPVPGDFDCEEVYKRQLTENDMKPEERSRLYIKKSAAHIICPEAFASPEETYIRALPFYDAALNHLPMVFRRTGKRCYLIGGWGDYVEANNLGPGDNVRIHELKHKSGNGERFFMIGRVQVMGALFG